MSVYEKMLNVMSKVGYLNKDGFVETSKGNGYKALTDEKVLTTIRPVLVEERLLMIPVKMDHRRTDEKVTAYDREGNKIERANRLTDVDMVFRFIDVDNPSDIVEVVSSGTGVDTQDKGIGKAQTYAKKYAILNSFLVPSGDDTDQISSEKYTEELIGKSADGTTQKPTTAPAAPAVPTTPAYGATPQTGDRNISIRTCIELARQYGKEKLINESGYNGRAWDTLSDEEVAKAKIWLVAVGKKAGAA